MADISWLAEACGWLVNNPLFSGVGGTAVVAFAGWLFGRKRSGQRAKAADGGSLTHVHGDLRDAAVLNTTAHNMAAHDASQVIQVTGDFHMHQGMSPAEVQQMLSHAVRSDQVPVQVLTAILLSMGENIELLDQPALIARLMQKAGEYVRLRAMLDRFASDDGEVVRLRTQAREALGQGRLREAEKLFVRARERDLAAIREQEEHTRQRRLSAAESCAAAAQAARLQTTPESYGKAAKYYAEAAALALAVEPSLARRYQLEQSDALYALGEEFGDNQALTNCIELRKALLAAVARRAQPLVWAQLQASCGMALAALGKRESTVARLKEAVAAYRAALEELTSEHEALDWAGTQNNLGNVLSVLGERTSDMAYLEQAVAAYRAALAVYTPKDTPLEWATTQHNLGAAFSTLGKQTSNNIYFMKAVRAYRAALKKRARKLVPLDWATTQNNLGNALADLGKRLRGKAHLEQAVIMYYAALRRVHTYQKKPCCFGTLPRNSAGEKIAVELFKIVENTQDSVNRL